MGNNRVMLHKKTIEGRQHKRMGDVPVSYQRGNLGERVETGLNVFRFVQLLGPEIIHIMGEVRVTPVVENGGVRVHPAE